MIHARSLITRFRTAALLTLLGGVLAGVYSAPAAANPVRVEYRNGYPTQSRYSTGGVSLTIGDRRTYPSRRYYGAPRTIYVQPGYGYPRSGVYTYPRVRNRVYVGPTYGNPLPATGHPSVGNHPLYQGPIVNGPNVNAPFVYRNGSKYVIVKPGYPAQVPVYSHPAYPVYTNPVYPSQVYGKPGYPVYAPNVRVRVIRRY